MTEQELIARLRDAGIENAVGEARILQNAVKGAALVDAVSRRVAHYPLQYILGEWPFYREVYEVNENCLIPRSDTEILVELAAKMLPNGANFLDLCTGSGCVAISTLAARPDTHATAVELFPETLALATRNAEKNGVRARFTPQLGNVLLPPDPSLAAGFDAILANPPYITDAAMRTLQAEVRFEPTAALAGGADGLTFYRAILTHWQVCLKPHGILLFEIGFDQGKALCHLAAEAGFCCEIKKDYGKNDRVAILTKQ